MSELNPFAPPLADGPRPVHADATRSVPFVPVSRTKFIVLCMATFGFYEVFWFYQQWRRTKERTGSDIWPIARAVFALFFTHALLRDVTLAAGETHVTPRFRVQASAWGFIIVTLLHRLPDPYWLVSAFAFVWLIPVQDTINEIYRRIAPTDVGAGRFTLGAWIAVALGLVVWALVIVGFTLPEEALSE